jgi:hypothetical protein
MKKRWSSFVWVSIVGSLFYALIRFGTALPGSIEYYDRFRPDESFLWFLIWPDVFVLFWAALALTVVTLITALFARVLRSLIIKRA